ncbi:hypothetical protein Tco_1107406 [Tanacetum coccineum]
MKINTPYPKDSIRRIQRTQYVVFKIWNQYNIMEDIKRDPYSKKSPIRRIQYMDTPFLYKLNTAYPLPLDTAYQLSGTETEIIDFRAKNFLPSFGINPTDCLSLVSGQFLKELQENTFSGSNNEDANEHIKKVLEIVDLFHVPNITVDQLMLLVFPISLIGAAARWLRNEPTGSIKTWEDLKTKFLNKYCPPGRTAKKMEEINNFQQEPDETLYQPWERFKELLMKCPQHYLTEIQEVILFYNGLDVPTRQILDSRGAVLTKTVADAKTTI